MANVPNINSKAPRKNNYYTADDLSDTDAEMNLNDLVGYTWFLIEVDQNHGTFVSLSPKTANGKIRPTRTLVLTGAWLSLFGENASRNMELGARISGETMYNLMKAPHQEGRIRVDMSRCNSFSEFFTMEVVSA